MQPTFASIVRKDKKGREIRAMRVLGGVANLLGNATFVTNETADIAVGDKVEIGSRVFTAQKVAKRSDGPFNLIDVTLK